MWREKYNVEIWEKEVILRGRKTEMQRDARTMCRGFGAKVFQAINRIDH